MPTSRCHSFFCVVQLRTALVVTPDAARARRSRGAGRAPTSRSRDRHPGGFRPGRPADGGRAGHRPGDPGSARHAGAPDWPGRAAFLPRQSQALQGGADRLAAAGPPLAHPADQTAQRGAGSAPATGGAEAERWAARTVSPRPASISGQRGGRRADRRAPRGRWCCRDAATPSPSAGDGAPVGNPRGTTY